MRFSPLLSLLVLAVAPLTARAQELTVRQETIQPREMGPLTYLELKYAKETYTLVPPAGWRMQMDASLGSLRFYSQAGTLKMALRFTTNNARETLSSTDTLRQRVAPDLEDATVLEEFPAYSGADAGKGLDLGYGIQGYSLRCRAAAIPIPGGCVHFVLTCGTDEFKTGQQTFGAMMTSFQRVSRTARTSQ